MKEDNRLSPSTTPECRAVETIQSGDFSALAENYARYRSGYSGVVLGYEKDDNW